MIEQKNNMIIIALTIIIVGLLVYIQVREIKPLTLNMQLDYYKGQFNKTCIMYNLSIDIIKVYDQNATVPYLDCEGLMLKEVIS